MCWRAWRPPSGADARAWTCNGTGRTSCAFWLTYSCTPPSTTQSHASTAPPPRLPLHPSCRCSRIALSWATRLSSASAGGTVPVGTDRQQRARCPPRRPADPAPRPRLLACPGANPFRPLQCLYNGPSWAQPMSLRPPSRPRRHEPPPWPNAVARLRRASRRASKPARPGSTPPLRAHLRPRSPCQQTRRELLMRCIALRPLSLTLAPRTRTPSSSSACEHSVWLQGTAKLKAYRKAPPQTTRGASRGCAASRKRTA
jgi:hypothetical protein